MITLQIIFFSTIISISYQIMIRPGELLQSWARWINITFEGSMIQKLLLCPYCFGGQIALCSSAYFIVAGNSFECLISVPCSIVLIYLIVENWFKNG